jgi:hypothetical protein
MRKFDWWIQRKRRNKARRAPCSSENRNLTVGTTITLAKARKIGLMDERTQSNVCERDERLASENEMTTQLQTDTASILFAVAENIRRGATVLEELICEREREEKKSESGGNFNLNQNP